ncbi:hypothetical protein ACFO3J_26690 [Streptomyces polygonati]|uniref:Uncharacterized protein n=1 Tax=Streptomyces polygonati TaxID=1617087 RepID=A0ABV8HTL4_9ACTN
MAGGLGIGLFDRYSRHARVRPVLIAVLPVLLVFAAELSAWADLRHLWVLIVLSGLPWLAEQMGRSRGKRLESELFRAWGGAPSVQLLRWRGPMNRTRLRHLRTNLQEIVGSSLRLPSEEEERADPEAADEVYEAVGAVLRVRARALPGAELVAIENREYGFRRNALGLRPVALATVAASLLAGALWSFAGPSREAPGSAALLFAALAVNAGLLAFWTLLVRPPWVEQAAWTYAERLLETAVVPDGQEPLSHPA